MRAPGFSRQWVGLGRFLRDTGIGPQDVEAESGIEKRAVVGLSSDGSVFTG
jgi:hypothetical protein